MAIATVPAEVTAFINAQRAFFDASENYVLAFSESAIRCSAALATKGVTLQKLADANKDATADLAPFAPKGTLYTSVEAVAYHALTGDLLSLDFDDDDEDDIAPMDVQTLVIKVKRVTHLGVKAVKAAIRNAESQQDAVRNLKDALKVKAPVDTDETGTDTAGTSGDDETDGETIGATGSDLPLVTVETLLSRAVALIGEGAEVSDSVRALVSQLVAATGPVAVPAAA